MTPRALLLPELCCTITEFLDDSPADLRSCALVSPHLTAAAQRILFHDIIFNGRCKAVGDLGLLPQYDESKACARFCAVVAKSPHLIPLVRRIRIGLGHEVGSPLSTIKFPNLNELVLHGRLRSHGVDIKRTPAAALLRTPSLRRVGLVYPIFRRPQDMYSLFTSVSPTVGFLSLQRVLVEDGHSLSPISAADYPTSKIKSLRLHRLYIHHPECLGPFDLSELRELDYGNSLTPVFARVLEEARESIVCLILNAEQAVKSLPSLLSGLPALTDLTLVSDAGTSAGIETLLSSLHPFSLLARLSLRLGGTLDVETAGLIGRACANAPACVVTVWFKASDSDGVSHLEASMRSAFVEQGGKGVFDVI
ncbi:hypothetical protein FB45DRAFT_1060067, partial [Roridomyces roridus]